MVQLPPAFTAVDGSGSTRRVPASRRRPVSGAGTLVSVGTLDDLDINPDVRGDKWYGTPQTQGLGRQMLRDAHCRQALGYIAAPLMAADWRFRAAGTSDLDKEIADFCQWAFIESLPFDNFIKEIVLGYGADGFALSEITEDLKAVPADRFPSHPRPAAGTVPTGMWQMPSFSLYRWDQSPENSRHLRGIWQWLQGGDVDPAGLQYVSSDRLLRFTYDQEGADFAGVAVLRPAYGPWKLKRAFFTIDAIKHERYGVGTPVVIEGEDPSDIDRENLEIALAEFRANAKGYMVLPNGYTWSLFGSNMSEGTNISEAIERCNKDIAVAVAAGFMLLGLTGKSGSFALGTTQQGQYHLYVESHARFIANTFNHGADGWSPVERLVRLNYGANTKVPRLEARNLPTRNWADVLPVLIQAKGQGLITGNIETENQIRDVLQFEQVSEEAVANFETVATEIDTRGESSTDMRNPSGEGTANAESELEEKVQLTQSQAESELGVSLNGAQVTAFRQIMIDVASRVLPRDSGIAALTAAFPISAETIATIMGSIGLTFFAPEPEVVATDVNTRGESTAENREELEDNE